MSTSYSSLVGRFMADLHFTPSAAQVELFKRDLMRVNQGLMAQSLTEVRAAETLRARPPTDARSIIMGVYGRKVAEQARLFPVFYCLESAYRSTLARWLHEHYRLARWWQPTYEALSRSQAPTTVKAIGSVAITNGISRTLGQIVRYVEGDDLSRGILKSFATGDELLREGTVHHLERLIVEHWSHFHTKFTTPSGRPPLTRGTFEEQFRKVREARNDTYHHKAISNRPDIVRIAETLVDHIDVHLGAALEAANPAAAKPYTVELVEAARHGVCRGHRKAFRLAAEIYANPFCVGEPDHLTWHRYAVVEAENAAEATRKLLDEMTHDERACAGSIHVLRNAESRSAVLHAAA